MKPAAHSEAPSRMIDDAVAFINANADAGITIGDIADTVYVSVRTLNRAFHRHLGVTPVAYLRSARLAGARRDLETGRPVSTTVTAVAIRWGFNDLGRFAAAYRDEYGETPRATLRT